MSINDTRARNLQIASKLRESGYKTAYHALRENFPKAYELLNTRLKEGLPFRAIINELERVYSSELGGMQKMGFGRLSIQSLSVFKKNYWLNMVGIPSFVEGVSKPEVEEYLKDWNSYTALIRLTRQSIQVANKNTETDLKLPVGTGIGSKLRREAFDMASICLEWETKLGIRKIETQSLQVMVTDQPETDIEIDDDDLIERGERAIAILKMKRDEMSIKSGTATH